MNRIMLWAWMLWSSYSLKVERNSGWGMHALVIALIKTRTETNIKITCCGNWGFERMHATKIEKPEHAAEKNDNIKKDCQNCPRLFSEYRWHECFRNMR